MSELVLKGFVKNREEFQIAFHTSQGLVLKEDTNLSIHTRVWLIGSFREIKALTKLYTHFKMF